MTSLRLPRLLDLKLFVLAACIFSAMPAQAATITIDDTAANETITISWDHFVSFFINFGPDLGPSGTVSGLSEQFPIGITGNWFATTFGQGTTDVYFLEPGTGQASDFFHAVYGGGGGPNPATINSGFVSDNGGTLIVPPGAVTIFEDDPNHEIGRLLANLPSDLSIYIFSDIEPVPEPTSILLLGTGLVVAARRWRTRHPNA
jgi:hypothetical protein